MSSPRMRPQFHRALGVEPAVFYTALQQALLAQAEPCQGSCFETAEGGGAILRLKSDERRIWSPALHLYPERGEQGEWQLHGRFSPSSPVWTAFVAIYLALACIGTAAACYGGAQMIMQEPPWAFVGVPVAMALAGFTYGAAFIGQGLGSEDMYALRAFVERVADGVLGNAAAAGAGDQTSR